MIPELRHSRLDLITGTDHFLTQVILDQMKDVKAFDPRPIGSMQITTLIHINEKYSATMCFGLSDTEDGSNFNGPTLVKSIWTPIPISSHDDMQYIIFDNQAGT